MKKITVFVITINLILLCCQYILTSMRATDGQILANLDNQLQVTISQNQQLQNSIYETLALNRIQQTAVHQSMAPVQISFMGGTTAAVALAFP